MTTTTYTVEGLTCPACMAEIMERVRAIPDVTGVAVDFVRNGSSPLFIRSEAPLVPGAVRDGVEKAGFRISGAVNAAPGTFDEPPQHLPTRLHAAGAR